MVDTCYKCGSSNELSLKNHQRNGKPLYICRPCRRAIAKIYKERTDKITPSEIEYKRLWRERAKASHLKILERIR